MCSTRRNGGAETGGLIAGTSGEASAVQKLTMRPCFSKFSSRRRHTNARYLFTSRRYRTSPLFNLMIDDDCAPYVDTPASPALHKSRHQAADRWLSGQACADSHARAPLLSATAFVWQACTQHTLQQLPRECPKGKLARRCKKRR